MDGFPEENKAKVFLYGFTPYSTGVARKKTLGVHQQILSVPNSFSTECYTSTKVKKNVSL